MQKKRARIGDVETDTMAELLELHPVIGVAKILRCSRTGLQYQMRKRGLKASYRGSPRNRENLSRAKLEYYGHPNKAGLIEILQDLATNLGHRPRTKDLGTHKGLPGRSVFESRFGSWGNALKEAGFDPAMHPGRRKSQKEKTTKKKNGATPLEKRIYKTVTPRLRYAVFARDSFRCVYCGRNPREDKIKLEADHIIPQSKGGPTTYSNLVACCQDCNQGKHNHYQLNPN